MIQSTQLTKNDGKKLLIYAFLPVILILLLTFWIFVKVNSADEELVEYILPLTFNGRIIAKNIDDKNHAAKYVVIKGMHSESMIFYDSFWYSIFDASEVGDSVYKNAGDLSLFVIDKNKEEKEVKYIPSKIYFHKRIWRK